MKRPEGEGTICVNGPLEKCYNRTNQHDTLKDSALRQKTAYLILHFELIHADE